jgi:hypothetical protein
MKFPLFIKDVFHPSNILICVANISVFVIFLILFFWFILSRQFDAIILEKVSIISLIAKYDPEFRKVLLEYLYSNNTSNDLIAKKQEELRYRENVNSLQIEVLPFTYILGTILILDIIYMVLHKNKLMFSEWILLILVLGAFITEVIFYFVLVNEWRFIGDFQLIYNILYSSP